MGAFFARSGRRSGASLARTSGDRHRDAGIHYHTATRCDTNWRSSGSVMPLALFEPTRRRIRGRRETLAPSEPDVLRTEWEPFGRKKKKSSQIFLFQRSAS
ncbi:hypothetical protein M747DRAFT_555 [Aspergillus niger ATCC 13496]|uniref:Uncharacterized protein n=1 Tax=Aspergillus niger ATCC 13496 TaxID=1353008 RepID=A0A370CED9_ASPNG|nr:hypothetical protein M747DRAFT_555 [Aspergillus niger ATCC 13496]